MNYNVTVKQTFLRFYIEYKLCFLFILAFTNAQIQYGGMARIGAWHDSWSSTHSWTTISMHVTQANAKSLISSFKWVFFIGKKCMAKIHNMATFSCWLRLRIDDEYIWKIRRCHYLYAKFRWNNPICCHFEIPAGAGKIYPKSRYGYGRS